MFPLAHKILVQRLTYKDGEKETTEATYWEAYIHWWESLKVRDRQEREYLKNASKSSSYKMKINLR